MTNIKNWTCPNCLKHYLPFQDLNCDKLIGLTKTLDKYESSCSNNFNLCKLCENYKYSKLLGDNNDVDKNNIQITCVYYDSDEFKKLTKTLPSLVYRRRQGDIVIQMFKIMNGLVRMDKVIFSNENAAC